MIVGNSDLLAAYPDRTMDMGRDIVMGAGPVAGRTWSVAVSQAGCVASTKRGGACRSFALPGRPYCVVHDPERAVDIAEARTRGGVAAARLRRLQRKRERLDTPKALVKFVANVVQETLDGTVTPDVARAVLYGISIQRTLIESSDLAARIAALEERLGQEGEAWKRRVG